MLNSATQKAELSGSAFRRIDSVEGKAPSAHKKTPLSQPGSAQLFNRLVPSGLLTRLSSYLSASRASSRQNHMHQRVRIKTTCPPIKIKYKNFIPHKKSMRARSTLQIPEKDFSPKCNLLTSATKPRKAPCRGLSWFDIIFRQQDQLVPRLPSLERVKKIFYRVFCAATCGWSLLADSKQKRSPGELLFCFFNSVELRDCL